MKNIARNRRIKLSYDVKTDIYIVTFNSIENDVAEIPHILKSNDLYIKKILFIFKFLYVIAKGKFTCYYLF